MDSKLYGAGNVAKTTVLLAGIGGLLVGVGYLVGGPFGAVLGLAFGVGISGLSYWKSDKLAVKAAGAVPVTEAEAPNLHAAVREISRRAEIPMPRVYFIESPQPNAFATGRNPEHAVVAVTRGLVDLCDRDELMGVIAHEVGHIRHRDILIGAVAAAVATAITFVANMAMWAGMFGGGGSDDDGPSPVAVIAIALTAPIAAGLLQMALSRSREFEADRVGAELMGDPEPLARALLKLDTVAARVPADVNPAQASAYIVNPLRGRKSATKWFMTHPPVEERVERLRALRVEPVR